MRLEPYLVSIATNILKRVLEPHYDRLAQHRILRELRSLSGHERRAVETMLYTAAAFIEVRMTSRTGVREVLKRLFEDMPSEFGSRIVNRPLSQPESTSPRPSRFSSLSRWCDRATEHLEKPFF